MLLWQVLNLSASKMSPVWIAWPKPGMCGNSWQVKSVKSAKSVKVSKLSPNYANYANCANVKKKVERLCPFAKVDNVDNGWMSWMSWIQELQRELLAPSVCSPCPSQGCLHLPGFEIAGVDSTWYGLNISRTSKSEVYPSSGGGCSIGCSPKRRGHMIPSSPCLCNHGLPRLQPEIRGHVPKKTWTRTPTDVHF